jgi:hypothetical protein
MWFLSVREAHGASVTIPQRRYPGRDDPQTAAADPSVNPDDAATSRVPVGQAIKEEIP